MAARIWQMFEETAGMGSGTRNYGIDNTDDESEALAALFAEAPASSGALLRDDKSLSVEHAGPSLWMGRADYRELPKRKTPQPASPTIVSFSTGGGTQKIYQSLGTSGTFPASGITTAPDFRGAIGVSGDTVNGTDIVVRRFSFKLRKVFEAADIDNAKLQQFHEITGTVNDNEFYGFPAGSVLLLGVDGDNQRGDEKYDITLTLEASRRVASMNVGDIVGIVKDGHDHIWFHFTKTVDDLANPPMPIMKADVAYVEKVYERTDFSALGFGTSL